MRNKKIIINGQEISYKVNEKGNMLSIEIDQNNFQFEIRGVIEQKIYFSMQDNSMVGAVVSKKDNSGEWVYIDGMVAEVDSSNLVNKSSSSHAKENDYRSPMPAKVFKVLVSPGEKISKGKGLLILEAMKMEHLIKAHEDGVVQKIYFSEGDQVGGGDVLIELKKDEKC